MKKSIGTLILAMSVFLISCQKSNLNSKNKETILYQTDFSQDDGKWYVGSTVYGQAGYSGGQYIILGRDYTQDCYLYSVFTTNPPKTAVEANVKLDYISGYSNRGFGGLVFNKTNNNNDDANFVFNISYNGYWGISKYSEQNGWSTVIDWGMDMIIRNNDFNKIRIERLSDNMNFYINDKKVYTMQSSSINSLDRVGLYANTHSKLIANHFKVVELK